MNSTKSRSFASSVSLTFFGIALALIAGETLAQSNSESSSDAAIDARTILITGANRGIGLELARQYSSAGWTVIGTARRPDQAEELRSLSVEVVQLDVTDQKTVDRLAEELNGRSIDVLINNAGILLSSWTLSEINIDDVNRTLAVNTVGPMRVTLALLENLRRGGLKNIINISSNAGSITGNTGGGFYGYRESKAALNMFTRSLAAELGREQFICIVVHPGWVQTDMGGSNAAVTGEASVAGIRSVIEQLTATDNGTFWSYDGKQLPW